MGYLLIIVSWILRTYGETQEQRNPVITPLVMQGDIPKTLLMVVWIILLGFGSYFIFSSDGIIVLSVSLVIYFLLAPLLFGKWFKKMMDKFGF